jgi:hypothetical protein
VDTRGLRLCYFLRLEVAGADAHGVLSALAAKGLVVLSHAVLEHQGRSYLGVITDVVWEQRMMELLPEIGLLAGVRQAARLIRLDKDNYRDIVEGEQSTYFGSSLER